MEWCNKIPLYKQANQLRDTEPVVLGPNFKPRKAKNRVFVFEANKPVSEKSVQGKILKTITMLEWSAEHQKALEFTNPTPRNQPEHLLERNERQLSLNSKVCID